MSRLTLVPVLVLAAAVAGCKGVSPSNAAQELGLKKSNTPTAPGSTPVAQEPPKPVPAQLPAVLAHVNGQDITKDEFERALRSVERRAGGPIPEGRPTAW